MPHTHQEIDISFHGPASYRITVKGRFDKLWPEDLGGMDIRIEGQGDVYGTPTTNRIYTLPGNW